MNVRGYPVKGKAATKKQKDGEGTATTTTLVYLDMVPLGTSKLFATQTANQICGRLRRRTFKNAERTEFEDDILLNLLYAPQGTPLFSLARVLSRVENLSHILAWSKAKGGAAQPGSGREYELDLVELPRLNITFKARLRGDGVKVLYSLDHSNLFVPEQHVGGTEVRCAVLGGFCVHSHMRTTA